MKKRSELQYEAHFKYSEGILNGTPNSWKEFAWTRVRSRTIGYVHNSAQKARNILVIGVGDGGILPHLRLDDRVQKIGVDVNKNFLLRSKNCCDVVLASASNLPLRDEMIHLVFFELVLHHLKGQRSLSATMGEAHRVLLAGGKIIAVEPSSLNPSGFLLNAINKFHFYSRLFGGSNYEYALSPKDIRNAFSDFSEVTIKALTFLNPRLPISVQRIILNHETFLSRIMAQFAWIVLITACKADR